MENIFFRIFILSGETPTDFDILKLEEIYIKLFPDVHIWTMPDMDILFNFHILKYILDVLTKSPL